MEAGSHICLIAIASLLAAGLSFWLAVQAGGKRRLPGCGDESGCAALAASRWARWMGLPVGWMGGVVYLAIALASFLSFGRIPSNFVDHLHEARAAFALMAVGSGGWFLVIQVFVVRRMCWYCNAVHVLGLGILVLLCAGGEMVWTRGPLAAAVAGLLVLIGGQGIWRPKTYAVVHSEAIPEKIDGHELADASTEPAAGPTEPPTGASTASAMTSRQVSLRDGKVILEAGEWPLLGRPDAEHLIALAFDYTCPVCRTMHRMVKQRVDADPAWLGVLLLPMPQHRGCNRNITKPISGHNYACQFARLGLALWRQRPDRYGEFDAYVMEQDEPPPLGMATRKATELMGMEFNPNSADSSLDAQIARAVDIFDLLKFRQIPDLLLPRAELAGLPNSSERLRKILESELAPVKV